MNVVIIALYQDPNVRVAEWETGDKIGALLEREGVETDDRTVWQNNREASPDDEVDGTNIIVTAPPIRVASS